MSSPPLLIERRARQAFSVTTTQAHDDHLGRDLASLLHEAGIRYSFRGFCYMAPDADPSRLVSEVVTILGAVGGVGGIAAILKAFFSRNKDTTVKFGENGEVLEAAGLSVNAIIRLLDKCSPRTPLDWVNQRRARHRRKRGIQPESDRPGKDFEFAMTEARRLNPEGSLQEVVGEYGVIRRYEDGHEVSRRPDCPPWCDQRHDTPHGLPVWHGGTIGTVTLPDGARVDVGISRAPDSQNLVTVGVWAPPGRLGAIRPALPLSEEHAIWFADLADLLGHADLTRHLKKAAATIHRDRASRRRNRTVSNGQTGLPGQT